MKRLSPASLAFSVTTLPSFLAQNQPGIFPLKDAVIPNNPLPQPGESGILATFLGPLVSLVPIITGLSSFIVIILAGIKYVSHSGNAQETQKASSMLTYALVGLILSAAAFWLTRLLFAVGGAENLF